MILIQFDSMNDSEGVIWITHSLKCYEILKRHLLFKRFSMRSRKMICRWLKKKKKTVSFSWQLQIC